jgi:putative tricarboxylic transport membrane protein
MNRNDALGGVLVFLFGVLTVCFSLSMPIGTFRTAGPGLFPLCLGLILAVLSAAFTLPAVSRRRRIERQEGPASGVPGSAPGVLGFMAAIAVAAGFLELLGYAPTAFLVVLALLQILGGRYWCRNLIIALAASTVSHFLFVRWLQIPFPQGWLGI